jgi:hypothetical protein
MPDLEFIRAEIERMRGQGGRQRREIVQLQRAGISTASAELLLQRMLDRNDGLCAQRDELKKSEPGPPKAKSLETGDGDVVAPRQRRQAAVD